MTHFSDVHKAVFSINRDTDKETFEIIKNLGCIAAKAILTGLRDERKATVEYLSSYDSKFSWSNTKKNEHKAGLRKLAVNDPTESSFGGRHVRFSALVKLG